MKKLELELSPGNIKTELDSSIVWLNSLSIGDLSFLELASLRQFVLDSIKDYNLHVKAINKSRSPKRKNQLRFFTMFGNIGQEAASRWLYFNYGLKFEHCEDLAVVRDGDNTVYQGYNRTEAGELFRKNFPRFSLDFYQSPEMKEYIRRIRADAHLI